MKPEALKKIIAVVACALLIAAAALFPACSCGVRVTSSNVVSITSSAADGTAAKYGSGVLVGYDDGLPLCLTNYHVINGSERIMVTPYDGNTVTADLLGYSEYHDIAVLRLTADYGLEFTDVQANNLFASAEKGGKVTSIGDKKHGGVAEYAGKCTATAKVITAETVGASDQSKLVPAVAVTCDIGEGMSGGAVLDSRGSLVGIGAYREPDESSFYAVAAPIARAVMNAAVRGDVAERDPQVALFGLAAQEEGFAAYITDVYGGAVILGKNNKSRTLHALGFAGTFLTEGFQVTAVGAACPVPEGAIITEIAGTSVSAGRMNEVFAALYGYRLTDATDGEKPEIVYILDGKTAAVTLEGGGFSLIKQ